MFNLPFWNLNHADMPTVTAYFAPDTMNMFERPVDRSEFNLSNTVDRKNDSFVKSDIYAT